MPSLYVDHWDLESAEGRHAEAPESFWIPSRPEREQLQPGQAAKLLFRIESGKPDGPVELGVERMWVYITERVDGMYLGMLDNQPGSIEAADDVYLVRGAEIPFGPEHVIDIATPPAEYIDEMRGASPTRTWPRS
jgi:hypothetical protein